MGSDAGPQMERSTEVMVNAAQDSASTSHRYGRRATTASAVAPAAIGMGLIVETVLRRLTCLPGRVGVFGWDRLRDGLGSGSRCGTTAANRVGRAADRDGGAS